MQIKINGKKYKAQEGEMILDVCRRENISIPTLCAHGHLKKEAVCRLCLVEINLTDKLVPSCAFPVCEKLEVKTESEKIKKAREINMELLWSDHAGKCVKCKRNRHCELQNLAEEYKIDNFRFVPRKEDMTSEEELDLLKDNRVRVVVEEKNPAISRTTEFCVECRRCINICPTQQYGFNNRAGDVVVGTPYEKVLDCIFCGACVKHCPTAALTDKNDLEAIDKKLNDLNVLSVALFDPAIMESIGNEFEGIKKPEELAGLLCAMGFEKVFDLGFGMEKYLHTLAQEVEEHEGIIFSNLCPSLNLYIEKYFPDLKKHISKVGFPDNLAAEMIKKIYAKEQKINAENIAVISISSCLAKKVKKGDSLDHVLTVRELGRMARSKGLNTKKIAKSDFDKYFPFDEKAKDMIKSGGTAKFLKSKTGKNKKISAVNKIEDIKKILESVHKREISGGFFEMTVCPGGCVGGGGQSIKIKE